MLFPFYTLIMLGFESASVVNRRLSKIARGGPNAVEEWQLMFAEKAAASIEAATAMMLGRTSAGTIARLRKQVADNELRLSSR